MEELHDFFSSPNIIGVMKLNTDIILPIALMALGSTQPLTELSTRKISLG